MSTPLACEKCGAVFWSGDPDAPCPACHDGSAAIDAVEAAEHSMRVARILERMPKSNHTCHLRKSVRSDGVRISTIDLWPTYYLGRDREASQTANALGRYETAVGEDYANLYRHRTWQQAWNFHEKLLAPGFHEQKTAEREHLRELAEKGDWETIVAETAARFGVPVPPDDGSDD